MQRRNFIKGLALLGLCPLCTRAGIAADAGHQWSYEGETGPDHWGEMGAENAACSAGIQQSPLDITGAIKADLPAISIGWKKADGTILNNGHTIQVNLPAGSALTRGGKTYELLQFHFHGPSEHLVEGKTFPMEVHFVHRDAATGALGVLGVFMVPGAVNATFAGLAAAFPAEAGQQVPLADLDPAGMLPSTLDYWTYEGSLTTPPCSEIVDWMVAMQPIEVASADIERFAALFKMNARPALAPNRRFILSSL